MAVDTFDSRWKNPQGSNAGQMHLWAQDLVKDLRKGNYLPTFTQDGTGAVERSIEDKLSEWISVKDFGAAGDGVADDTDAIQAAIDYAETINHLGVKGAAVHFPSGLYITTATITVQEDGIYLVGQGRGPSAIARQHDAGPTFRFSRETNTACVHVGMENLYVIDSGGTMTEANSPFHLEFDYINNLYLRNIRIEQGAGGIAFSRVAGAHISDVYVSIQTGTATSRRGMRIQSTSISSPDVAWGSDMFMANINIWVGTGTAATTNADYGLDVIAVDGLWINGLHIANAAVADMRIRRESSDALGNVYISGMMMDTGAGHGVLVDGANTVQTLELRGRCSTIGVAGATSRGVNITGPVEDVLLELSVEGYDSDGIYIDNSSANDITIRSGSVRGNDADSGGTAGGGLYVKQANRVSVIGGTYGGAGTEDWGIRVGDGVNGIAVTGTCCKDNQGPGIQLDNGSNRVLVVANMLNGNTGGAITDNCVGTKLVANNLV